MLWQQLGWYDYGPHWPLVALTVGVALVGVVTFGSLAGSMLPFRPQAPRLRSRERVGAVRGDARRRHGPRDLLQRRGADAARHAAVRFGRDADRLFRRLAREMLGHAFCIRFRPRTVPSSCSGGE